MEKHGVWKVNRWYEVVEQDDGAFTVMDTNDTVICVCPESGHFFSAELRAGRIADLLTITALALMKSASAHLN